MKKKINDKSIAQQHEYYQTVKDLSTADLKTRLQDVVTAQVCSELEITKLQAELVRQRAVHRTFSLRHYVVLSALNNRR